MAGRDKRQRPAVPRVPGLDQVPPPWAPGLVRLPPRPVPVVALLSGRWRPGLIIGWWRNSAGWMCQLLYQYRMDRVSTGWFRYETGLVFPVEVDNDPMDWWHPEHDPHDGVDF